MLGILGNSDEINYFIIDELSVDELRFDGLPMTERGKWSSNYIYNKFRNRIILR